MKDGGTARLKWMYAAAKEEYRRQTALLDEQFYCLCRKHPDHRELGVVRAKLYIIGLAFKTGISRTIMPIDRLAEALCGRAPAIDRTVSSLRDTFSSPLQRDHLQKMVDAHGEFTQLVHELLSAYWKKEGCRKKQPGCPRTFAAKYLHCHCPTIPIFDNVAKRQIARVVTLVPRSVTDGGDLNREHADNTYCEYVEAFWRVYSAIEAAKYEPAGVRIVDYMIYYHLS